MNFNHLKIKVSTKWLVKERFISFLQVIVYRIPFLGKVLRVMGRIFLFVGDLEKTEGEKLKYLKLLQNDCQNPQSFGSSYGYEDEDGEFRRTLDYHKQLQDKNFKGSKSESELLYKHAIEKIFGIIKSDDQIKNFVNFGVSYAHIDSILAKLYPQIEFLGIDRSRYTKLYNEWAFSDIANMKFIAGDVMEVLLKTKFDNGIFFHMRTLTLLPKSFIEKLYKEVFKSEFRYIIGLEPIGISRQSFRPYEFLEEDRPSILYRGFMFIHNYFGILKRAGFNIVQSELVKTNHPHEDARILSFVGERKR
ncbi:MAG: hypothetical protein AMJ78_01740 [Omnitrophica WOR_2 bacterium SM23_29]|nr:MAG: hypothetical protein AMJ78_01740 [Omnitrophica WOR_2 bacterium SM23_29]